MSGGGSVAACGFAPRREAARGGTQVGSRYQGSFLMFIAILTAPLVGHGCHRDDLDHEPLAAPPVAAHEADPKTSR